MAQKVKEIVLFEHEHYNAKLKIVLAVRQYKIDDITRKR